MQHAKFPSVYLVHAAVQVVKILGTGSQSREALRSSYHSTASGGRFPARQLVMAENWLIDIGWLVVNEVDLRISPSREHAIGEGDDLARALIQSIIFDGQPSWLAAVHTTHGPRFDFIPTEAMEVLQELYNRQDREALLLAAASKFDESLLVGLGELGEETVLTEWRSALRRHGRDDLLGSLRHVSLVSDALGYDIVAPRLDGSEMFLEVKCYRGRIPRCFISRNEFEVGQQLTHWCLVLCQATTPTEAIVVGWMSGEYLKNRVPRDCDEFCKWQSARITFRLGELNSWLPMSA